MGVENRVKYWDNCPKCKVLVENFVFDVEMMTHLHLFIARVLTCELIGNIAARDSSDNILFKL